MSDQRHHGGRRPPPTEPAIRRPPAERYPPERFAQARSDQRQSGGYGSYNRASVLPRERESEPELLTHPASSIGPGGAGRSLGNRGRSGDGYDWSPGAAAGGGDGSGWPPRWRRARNLALIGALLCVLLPVLAFFVGWLFLDVPSPAALAAQRKQVTTIMASDGTTEVGRYVPEEGNRIPVSLAQVPVHVQNAVLAAEDRSFRSNPGFDITGIARATWDQFTGGGGGGSTITQQYIKVATGHDEYSIFRKFREVIVAAKLTKQESKDRILEDYLNTIYFGRGAYGIQAASQAYFKKNVQNLTVSEAAVLAATIRSPSRLDPGKNLAQAQDRWNFVLAGMVEQGWLSPADRGVGLYPDTVPPGQTPGAATDDRAHIVDRVMDELDKQGTNRAQLAVNGGRITTTIDPRAQQLARDAVLTELRGQPKNLHSSLVAIDPRSGAVIAYYGGSDGNGFDLAGGPVWNPGSAFKPFTMLAALEHDIGMNSIYNGNSPLVIDGRSYNNSESRNFPQLTLHDAMTQSVNTAFVRLAQDVGPQAIRDAAIQAGIPEQINGKRAMSEPDSAAPGLGITLGQYPVHTIDMASAYATFAADGRRHEPYFVRQYANSHGIVDYQHVDKSQPAFDQVDADRNTQLARNVTATLTDVARSSQIPLAGGRQVAAKTGTHQRGETGNNSAAWTVGYTPSISAAVWVGDPANTAIKNANGSDIFGRGVPGLIWERFMNSYLMGTPLETFPPFTVIGPAPPPVEEPAPAPTRTRQPRDGSPSATPGPNFDDLVPMPIDPNTKPSKPRRNSCFPFCDSPPPDNPDNNPGNNNNDNPAPADGGQDRPRHF
ncbi:MAG TPA: transglycosylase domain-containing protein [Pseudonocardiaceae bacterium]|nr:transglycosylase domain-containing protein [Pseudonocardiaceae bacterium]